MQISFIKEKLKGNKVIYSLYMKLYGNTKRKKTIELAKTTLQNEGLFYLDKIENALKRSNAKFFVNFGSLMRLLRDGKFISWDNDIDYGIYITEKFQWKDLEEAMNSINMKLSHQFTYNGNITEQTYKSDKLTVDFFEHTEDEDNSYEIIYFRKEGYEYTSLYDAHVCRLKMYKFLGVETKTLNGINFSIPSEAEKYLASIYTDNWRIPDPNWISSKGPAWNELPDAMGKAEYF